MENITIQKSSLVAAYRSGNKEQRQMLEQLYGKEVFATNWRDITSYEKAEFVGNQFFELCCACYGLTPKMD